MAKHRHFSYLEFDNKKGLSPPKGSLTPFRDTVRDVFAHAGNPGARAKVPPGSEAKKVYHIKTQIATGKVCCELKLQVQQDNMLNNECYVPIQAAEQRRTIYDRKHDQKRLFCQFHSPHIKPQQKHHNQGHKEKQWKAMLYCFKTFCEGKVELWLRGQIIKLN